MAIPITVPRLGWTMDEGTFVEWLKGDGDRVEPGAALFVLESDKATETIESLDAGTLRIPRDGPQPGDKVKVGQVLGYLTAQGETVPTVKSSQEASLGARSASKGKIQPSLTPRAPTEGRTTISPRARRVARSLGLDWSNLQGSGRNGRIRERDVRAAAEKFSEGRLIPLTNARRVIAARMVAGVTQAAPVTLTTRVDAMALVQQRGQLVAEATEPEDVPGYTELIVKQAADALRHHPLLQAQWRDEGLFVPERIHVAVAVDTEAGLLAPVLRNADQLTLQEVTARLRSLIDQARAGRLTAEQMRGATFTVTNLGMFGVDAFTPIIHLPQCAVLGVGRIVREPAVVEDRIVPRDVMTLSLTFDHRVIDGAPAARFLDFLRRGLERPNPA